MDDGAAICLTSESDKQRLCECGRRVIFGYIFFFFLPNAVHECACASVFPVVEMTDESV